MNKKRTLLIVIVAVLTMLCVVGLILFQSSHSNSTEDKPLFELLKERGFESASGKWLDSLDDEQRAALDIAYEASVASGFQGSMEEWVSEKLLAHVNHSGDIVVVLPDGGEFVVSSGNSPNKPSGPDESEETQSEKEAADSAGDEELSAKLVIDEANAHPGDDNVLVSVRIEDNPGILGLGLSLSYDDSVLSLQSAENGEAFRESLTLTRSRSFGSGCQFAWDGVDLPSSSVKDGSILDLYFDIPQSAGKGVYPIVIRTNGSAFDNNLHEAALTIVAGSIVVE